MIRVFCDMCDREITDSNGLRPGAEGRLTRGLHNVKVEVQVAVDGAWNGGAVCKDCVLDVVTKGADL